MAEAQLSSGRGQLARPSFLVGTSDDNGAEVDDNGNLQTTNLPRVVTGLATSSADMTTIANVSAAPAAGLKLVVQSVIVANGHATNSVAVTFTEETSGTVIAVVRVPAGDTRQVILNRKLSTAAKRLRAQASATGQVEINVLSYTEA